MIRNEKLESRRVVQLFSEIVYEDISKRKYPPTLIFNDPMIYFFTLHLFNLGILDMMFTTGKNPGWNLLFI